MRGETPLSQQAKSKIMANNFFIGNQDPLMNSKDYSVQIQELDKIASNIAQRKAALEQMRGQVEQTQQPAQSQTPIWDEIDSIINAMSDKEFELVTGNEEFKESQNVVLAVLQAQYMKIMRPIVEQSKEGKESLESHLSLVKRLKKMASKEVDNEINEFKEYKEKYSDMPYAEYLKMKSKSRKK